MPYTVTNPTYQVTNYSPREKFNYTYPNKLDLKPGSPLHQRLLGKLMMYARESSRVMSQRRPSWNKMDDKLTAYIPLDEKEKKVKNYDPRRPVSIVFPYSYAILETLVSYLLAAFGPEPIFRYEGSAPEDVAGAILMEKVINSHCNRNKVLLNLHTMFRDACAYGMGAVSPQWMVKMGKKIVRIPNSTYDDGGVVITGEPTIQMEEGILYEGNGLVNIDPYYYLPDPNVSIHDVQKGEFVGWMDRDSYINLLDQEQDDPTLFNVKYVKGVSNKMSSIFTGVTKERDNRNNNRNSQIHSTLVTQPVDLLHMYVKLIPKDCGLGSSRDPEKWLFGVAADTVIIRAQPLNLNHNMFPTAITCPDFDGYSPVAYSRLEILNGMQVTMDWLFNSHVANVRKAINDVLVVDPYLVNVRDLEDPEPGKIIRLRRPAWGKGVTNAVTQLPVTDITRQNLQDVQFLIQYMQQVGGTDNPLMGNLRRGGPERLTSTEFRGTAQGAVNRLERVARIVGLQGMQDIGYMFAYHAQELMEEDVWLRTVGDWPQQVLAQFQPQSDRIKVRPRDIQVDYDLIVRDGSVPGGNFSESWIRLFEIISNNPQLIGKFDVFRIFNYIATNLGAKNVGEFQNRQQTPQIAPTVTPDEVVEDQVNRGNMVPVEEAL